MFEALIYKKLKNQSVQCRVCQRRCFINEGKTGFCSTKLNSKGKLYSLNYGRVQGIQVDPIEKKPFYHFRPGSLVPSVGSFGCNFRCKQCLNFRYSWGEPASLILKRATEYDFLQAADHNEIIKEIVKNNYSGIAFTYNEPVIWVEYVLALAKAAKHKKLFTLFVTNGSWTKETLDKIGPFIDAANIDFKGFSEKTYQKMGGFFGQIPEMAKYAQTKHNIHLEITTLLIPGINDSPKELKQMAEWIVKELGPKTPWHLSRYDPFLAPDFDFQKILPTTISGLKKAKKIGQIAGLEFIYIWAPGNDLKNGVYSEGDTRCPNCGKLAVSRQFWKPAIIGVDKNGNCLFCQEGLNLKLK